MRESNLSSLSFFLKKLYLLIITKKYLPQRASLTSSPDLIIICKFPLFLIVAVIMLDVFILLTNLLVSVPFEWMLQYWFNIFN